MSPSPATNNPIADELIRKHDELSPPAQQALGLSKVPAIAETSLAPQMPLGAPEVQPAQGGMPDAASTFLPAPSKVRGLGPLEGSPQAENRNELARVQASKPGYMNINIPGKAGHVLNPVLKGLAGIGDVIGTGFFPRAAAAIPGTTMHHQMLVNQLRGNEQEFQGQQAAEDTQRLREAQAENAEAMPELNAAKLENTALQKDLDRASREGIAQGRNETSEANTQTRTAAQLRKAGWRENPQTGEFEPIPYDELPEADQINQDLKRAQAEVASARRELVSAQAANEPERMKLAQARVEHANRASDIALQRLQLSNKQYEARYHGTEGGAALPGALLTDTGQPVGSVFQQNVRPTGQERNKGDMAMSAHEQLSTIKQIVTKRPDIFGPAAGRKTDFTVWIGSQDPDAQRFRAARTIAGDHLAGTFGGRSEAALKALDDAIGQFKDNPAALQAGLDQLDKANNRFVQAGTVRTAGSSTSHEPPTITTADEFRKLPSGTIYIEDGKKYRKP